MAKAAFGLTLYPQDDRYNQDASLSLTFAAGDLAGAFEPVENNLNIINDVTVTRTDGSSARYTQPAGQPYATTGPGGVAAVPSAPALNLQNDTGLINRASWLVHLGTVDEDRHPTLQLDLRRRTKYAAAWATTAIGDRIQVTGSFPTGGRDADLVVEGWEEELGRFLWQVTVNCSPNRPWQVLQVADSALGRVESAGSTLSAAAASGSTSLSLASTGPLWTTQAGDFPLDLEISGIKVTASTISGSSSPQTATVTGVTKDLHVGDAVTVWRTGVIAL